MKNFKILTFVLLVLSCLMYADVNYVYIADSNLNSVFVLDADNGHTPIPGSPFPTGGLNPIFVAINPQGTRIYVSNSTSGDIAVLDALTLDHIPGSPFGGFGFVEPIGIKINSTGDRVYVADNTAAIIHLFDADMNPITTFPSGGTGSAIVDLSSDDSRLYVANETSNSISIFDATTTPPTPVIPPVSSGGMNPIFVAINPSQTRVYTANNATGDITYFDMDLNVLLTVPSATSGVSDPVGISFHPDGTVFFVADRGTNSISILDPDTLTPLQAPISSEGTIPTFVEPNPRRTLLYVTNSFGGTETLSIRELNTLTPIVGSPFGGFNMPFGIAFTPTENTPPLNQIFGVQIKNDFGLIFELYNEISWYFDDLIDIVELNVYRDGVKIASLPIDSNKYEDHNRKPGVSHSYSVTTVDASGSESSPISVTIN